MFSPTRGNHVQRPWATRLLTAALLVLPALDASAASLSEEIADLDAQLAAIVTHGANYPATLDLHRLKALAYARAFSEDCHAHQAAASAEAELYEHNAYAVLLPAYEAHRLSLDATLAFGRGQCADSDEDLVRETETARDLALEGLEVAAKAHAYDDEAFLRFQVAHYLHILGDEDDSQAMLASAIALDDAHGLVSDGDENRTILAQWKKVDPNSIPKALQPSAATLTFNWSPTDIDIDSTIVSTHIQANKAVAETFDATGKFKVSARPGGGFRVANTDVALQSRSAFTADDSDAHLAHFLQEIVAQMPAIDVAADGSYVGFSEYAGFIEGMQASAKRFIEAEYPVDDDRRKAARERMTEYLSNRTSREVMEIESGRTHALNTAIWIGATLTTGETMTINLGLPLDGVPKVAIPHRLEFRLDGPAPCHSKDGGAPRCVEIEMEATPEGAALAKISAALIKQGKGALHYWSTLNGRIVVDPSTLEMHEQDSRRSYYLQLGDGAIEAQVYQSHDRLSYRH